MSNRKLSTLKHLQEYVNQHDQGNDALKKSFWQLTKSRRNSRSLTLETRFDPDLVREELQARTKVKVFSVEEAQEEVPDLNDENNGSSKSTNPSGSTTTAKKFQLIDLLDEHAKEIAKNKETSSKNKRENADDSTGLRQRKNASAGDGDNEKKKKVKSTTSNEWTIVDHPLDSENEFKYHNPIELFGGGLAPRELQVAQKEAKHALEAYIQAANQVTEILQLINNDNTEGNVKKNVN